MDKLFIMTIIFLASSFLFAKNAYCNNLQLIKGELIQDTSADTADIQLDISWENSWKDTVNYDAVWLFIKYYDDSTSTWEHATLSASGTDPSGFSAGSDNELEIVVPTDRKGCFIQRTANESGSIKSDSVQIVWDYGFDGLADADIDDIGLKVFGIEMVYIPQGAFWAGDGDGSDESGKALHVTDNTAVQISTVKQNNVTCDTNSYCDIDTTPIAIDGDDGIDTDGDDDIDNANWPTGYNAFYLMKYELTQGQYVGMLNTLNRNEQNTRTQTDVSTDAITNIYVMSNSSSIQWRNDITCPATDNGTTAPIVLTANRPHRAMGYAISSDIFAFADWAALRPFTELEFEKAARGPLSPVVNEYVWGTTNYNNAQADEIYPDEPEDGDETISDVDANILCGNVTFTTGDGGIGVVRVGIFAESSTTTRAETGAGYYGAMNLSGNASEVVVSLGTSAGRSFAGTHGDGELFDGTGTTYDGNASNNDWPGFAVDEGVSGGIGCKMGYSSITCDTTLDYCRLSERNFVSYSWSSRAGSWGGRVARTAP